MKIKEIRTKTGLSQSKFAAMYNISVRTLQDWEIERRTPPEYVTAMLERLVNEDFPTQKEGDKTL